MLSITYHDIIEDRAHQKSGFPDSWARIYKLEPQEFARHLQAIRDALGNRQISGVNQLGRAQVRLTFDDGGVSAYEPVAGMLEHYGWRGHFFITTDWIGQPGFLTEAQIRDLDRRGHTIGSHSCSHPTRMAHLSWDELLREWRNSTMRLAGIVGHPVTVASVPGGYYSPKVAKAAAYAGIRKLFTSEPTTRVAVVDGCRVLGRYVVQRGMGPEWSGGFASGDIAPRLKQALLWKTKSVAKRLGGRAYLRLAQTVLNSRAT